LLGDSVGGWIRPVSDREREEVSAYERQYRDGSDPRVLDVIDVPLIEPRRRLHQRENWLLDPNRYWVKIGEFPRSDVNSLVEVGDLWLNGHNTYNGLNDYVPVEAVDETSGSLKLIALKDCRLRVYSPGSAFGNPERRVQAIFAYRGTDYCLWVTDPVVESEYLARDDGVYTIGRSVLTVSLAEPHDDGRCYKVVAAVIGG
jgi:hypothetical protein